MAFFILAKWSFILRRSTFSLHVEICILGLDGCHLLKGVFKNWGWPGAEEQLFSKGALIKRNMRFSLFPNIWLNISQILRGPPLGPRPFEDDYVIIKVKFCLIVLKPFSKKHSFLARSTQSASNSTSIIQSHNEYVIQIPKVTL